MLLVSAETLKTIPTLFIAGFFGIKDQINKKYHTTFSRKKNININYITICKCNVF